MSHLCFASASFALILSASNAAPLPRDRVDAPIYYATARGSTWVYESDATEKKFVLTKVEAKGSSKIVTICSVDDRGAEEHLSTVEICEGHLTLVKCEAGESKLEPAMVFLKRPVQAGESWSADYRYQNVPYHCTVKVFEPEEIVVPAGRFRALRVETRWVSSDETIFTETNWYAAGIGSIKKERNGTVLGVLKRFEPGKE